MVKIEVTIDDVNDNAPMFGQPRLAVALSESVQPRELMHVMPATDADSPPNGVAIYRLLPANDRFGLLVSNASTSAPSSSSSSSSFSAAGGTTTMEVRVTLLQSLDRETASHYELQLVAYDGGSPRLSGVLTIDVTILDVNDNSPRFANASYEVSVSESARAGVVVARVHADDADEGRNADVRYEFSKRTTAVHGRLFAVDARTGAVVLLRDARTLDQPVYNLGVVATDAGDNAVPSMVSVVVAVIDVNEHRPVIHVDVAAAATTAIGSGEKNAASAASVAGMAGASGGGGAGSGSGGDVVVEVAEFGHPNTSVAMVSVTDADRGDNGRVRCSLTVAGSSPAIGSSSSSSTSTATGDFALIQLYEGVFNLATTRSLDNDRQRVYRLTVDCRDGGRPPMVAARNLTVVVAEVSEDSPAFSQPVYNATLSENTAADAVVVVTVAATDRDRKRNGLIEYGLDADVQGSCSVLSFFSIVLYFVCVHLMF